MSEIARWLWTKFLISPFVHIFEGQSNFSFCWVLQLEGSEVWEFCSCSWWGCQRPAQYGMWLFPPASRHRRNYCTKGDFVLNAGSQWPWYREVAELCREWSYLDLSPFSSLFWPCPRNLLFLFWFSLFWCLIHTAVAQWCSLLLATSLLALGPWGFFKGGNTLGA